MEDIDKTFEKLSKEPFNQLKERLHSAGYIVIFSDSFSFKDQYIYRQGFNFNGTGWTEEEFKIELWNINKTDNCSYF